MTTAPSDQLSFGQPQPGEVCPTCLNVVPEPLSDLNARPRSHSDGPDTEKIAALRTWPRAMSGRSKILMELYRTRHDARTGRTWWELQEEMPMRSAQPRVSDLFLGGWIVESGITRPTDTGSPANAYVLSDRALREFERLGIAELYDQQAEAR
jgi:hypothetical protein